MMLPLNRQELQNTYFELGSQALQIRHFIAIFFLVFGGQLLTAQSVQLDIRANEGVLDFIDELNNLQLTDASYLIQPVSRLEVASVLFSIDSTTLNKRQRQQLRFYRQAFSKDLPAESRPQLPNWITSPFQMLDRYKQPDIFYYSQGSTTVSLNPIIGMTILNNENGSNWQRRIGGDFQAYIGKIGLYGSVRDVSELKRLTTDSLLTPREGALYKLNGQGGEYSESRGGITYGGDWGYIGLVRDHVRWGYGYYGSNILDMNAPPFTQLKLHVSPVDWFKFDYFHGSLQSNVVDSSTISNVNGVTTFDFYNKYMAANMLSFRPWKRLWVSFGNSIIYSARTPEPTYFVPVMFYKSADHYLNRRSNRAGGNAQMFAAASIRPLKKLHLYSTLFVDEVSFGRMFDEDRHSNWFSIKSGFRWTNLLPNTTITFEHIRSNAMIYKHFIETTDYSNAEYSLGHYLRDNAREFILGIDFKPLYWLQIDGRFQYAEKGADIVDNRPARDPVTNIVLVQGIDYLANTSWIQTTYSLRITALVTDKLRLSAAFDRRQNPFRNNSYQAAYYLGEITNTFSVGVHYGF